MTKTASQDRFAGVRAAEEKIAELQGKAATLRQQRDSLTIDPAKPIEAEIAAKLKAEAKIDTDLAPIELALDHLKDTVPAQWGDLENQLAAEVKQAAAEVSAILEASRETALRVLAVLFPGEDCQNFRAPYVVPSSAHAPVIDQPVWEVIDRMIGVKDARELHLEAAGIACGWNSPIEDTPAYVRTMADFLDSLPARKAAVKASVAAMATVTGKQA